MVPNAEHSLAGHETSVMFAIRAFYLSVVDVSKIIICCFFFFFLERDSLNSFKGECSILSGECNWE